MFQINHRTPYLWFFSSFLDKTCPWAEWGRTHTHKVDYWTLYNAPTCLAHAHSRQEHMQIHEKKRSVHLPACNVADCVLAEKKKKNPNTQGLIRIMHAECATRWKSTARSPCLIRIVLHLLKLSQGIQLKAAADKVKGVANIPTLISPQT